jgi:KIX domain
VKNRNTTRFGFCFRRSTKSYDSIMSAPSPVGSEKKPTGEDDIGTDEDWRASVQQSFRNAEVREIAKVLASLEPGSKETSKLRLAMQFEDSVFKSATSLADYRKRLTKRLKKVQKSYKPPIQDESKFIASKERELQELRQQYGDAVRYVIKYAGTAYNEMKDKHGEEKAIQLKQHTDGVRLWATDLGLLDGNSKPNLTISADQLKKLKDHLERRLENIRCHVVRLADPDQFMAESLEKVEKEFKDKSTAVTVLAEYSKKRYEGWQKKTIDAEVLLMESLEQANKSVPLPTRNQRNDELAALIHLDKMRAASTALFAYMAMKDKDKVPRNSLVKVHNIASEGAEFVQKVMHEHRKQHKPQDIMLQDAWMKQLILQVSAAPEDSLESTIPSPLKRTKLSHSKPVLRSRILLTKNRKTPTSILQALKRKRATLVRPPPHGEGSYLVLEFGKAFVMHIYFVPLLVSIRAYNKSDENEDFSAIHKSQLSQSATGWKGVKWTPLHDGLSDCKDITVYGVKGTYDTIGYVVEERLRDCSAHATNILRKCFAKHVKEDCTKEFELEIYEASALLEFLHIARTTYIPNWEDDDKA